MKWLQAQPLGERFRIEVAIQMVSAFAARQRQDVLEGIPSRHRGSLVAGPTARINFHATFAGTSDAQGRADLILSPK